VTAVTGAATPWVHDRLTLPTRTVRVLHSGRDAVYLDDRGVCLALLSWTAVAVPCGIRTILDAVGAAVATATVGDGCVTVGPLEVRLTRYVDAAVPRVARLPEVEVTTDELPEQALRMLAEGDPRCVASLLGRGSGLTPLGDDVLCGWLAARIALGLPTAAVAEEVALLSHRTTVLSATLLECAARGEVVPQFGDLLRGLVGIEALLAVGHTSGLGLALGMSLAS
jgi:hypothetical protein